MNLGTSAFYEKYECLTGSGSRCCIEYMTSPVFVDVIANWFRSHGIHMRMHRHTLMGTFAKEICFKAPVMRYVVECSMYCEIHGEVISAWMYNEGSPVFFASLFRTAYRTEGRPGCCCHLIGIKVYEIDEGIKIGKRVHDSANQFFVSFKPDLVGFFNDYVWSHGLWSKISNDVQCRRTHATGAIPSSYCDFRRKANTWDAVIPPSHKIDRMLYPNTVSPVDSSDGRQIQPSTMQVCEDLWDFVYKENGVYARPGNV